MSSWEAQDGKRTFYIQIGSGSVVIGNHYGSGHTDNAGSFSFEEMRKGGWDAHIERHFGSAVLAQVKAAVGATPERASTSKTSPARAPAKEPGEPEWEDFD